MNFAIPSKYLIALISKSQNSLPLSAIKGNKIKQKGQQLITQSKEEVLVKNLDWLKDGGHDPYGVSDANPLLNFSIYNGLENPISDISLLLILYDRENLPVDYSYITISKSIPSKLAKKITNIESSSEYAAESKMNWAPIKLDKKRGYRCVIRILDFSTLAKLFHFKKG